MEHVTEISGLLLLYPEKIADKLNELQSLAPISGSRACINYVACVPIARGGRTCQMLLQVRLGLCRCINGDDCTKKVLLET